MGQDKTTEQKIKNTSDNPKDPWLVCVCQNTAESDGFVTCSSSGAYCPPLPRKWDGIHLCCSRCGRIVNQNTLAIIGQRDPADLLKEVVIGEDLYHKFETLPEAITALAMHDLHAANKISELIEAAEKATRQVVELSRELATLRDAVAEEMDRATLRKLAMVKDRVLEWAQKIHKRVFKPKR